MHETFFYFEMNLGFIGFLFATPEEAEDFYLHIKANSPEAPAIITSQ
jgi:hypothetical protein